MIDLPTNQADAWMPSLAEREERLDHREWIGGRIVTLLSHYWRDDDDDALTSAIAADWADVLEGLPRNAIQKACIQYQRDHSNARRKPTPAAIYALAVAAIPRPKIVRNSSEPPRDRCDPKTAQAICEAAGFTPKRFGGEP